MNRTHSSAPAARSWYARNDSNGPLARAVAEALEPRRLLATFVVNTTADTVDDDPSVTSLREAITASNTLPGVDRIEFNIGAGGPQTIRPTSFLPSILTGVVIDARTQPGYAGKPIIQISGELAGANADGLRVGSLGSTIRGLVISNFTANGIQITNLASGNTIAGNYVGTDLSGTLSLPNARGLLLRGSDNTIGGITPEDRNVISGNASASTSLGRGVEINGTAAAGNVVLGNYVGVDATGTTRLTNTGDGFSVIAGAHDNLIGGATPAARNVISGNRRVGIWVNAPNTTGNLIQGNFIGTDPTGNTALPNALGTDGTFAGVMFDNAPGNTADGNLISGNNQSGVRITGSSAFNNLVVGNRIGTNAGGTAALPNTGDGVSIYNGASGNQIGGASAAAANVISGNRRLGVWVNGSSTTGNAIQGNLIGTDAAGHAALGNGFGGTPLPGVMFDNAPSNTLGGQDPAAGNVISGNNVAGVRIAGFAAHGNRVQGNRIGTTADGAAALGNVGPGVLVDAGAYNNVIGADGDNVNDAAEGNLISANTGGGILITSPGTQFNSVSHNLVGTDAAGAAPMGNASFGVRVADAASYNTVTYNTIEFNDGEGVGIAGGPNGSPIGINIQYNAITSNAGLGIDLGSDGVTPNDPFDADAGPNDLQNAPVLDGVSDAGGRQAQINGRLAGAPFGFYQIDLYASPAGNPADVTEGARYLGSTYVFTDFSGQGSFSLLAVDVATGEIVTATATGNSGTSEFSSRVTADPGGPFVLAEGQGTNGQVQVQLSATALDLRGDPVTLAWDLNNDGLFDDSTAPDPTLTLPDDGPLDRVVSLRVTNSAGQSSVNSTLIRIYNVGPTVLDSTINSSEAAPLAPGAPTVFSGHFTDPGLLDTHTATVDWGDGTVETVPLTRPAGAADGAFNLTHTYASGGIYQPFVIVADDDGYQAYAVGVAYVTGAGIQFGNLNVVGTSGNDKVVLTANPDGTVSVAANFLAAPATVAANDLFFVNVVLSGKNDQASVVGPLAANVGMSGGDGNDTLSLGQAAGYLFGGAGNDVLTGGPNFTELFGDFGNDTLNAGPGYTYALGGPGNDVINGSTAPDAQGGYYTGDDGNDVITGSAASFEYLSGGNGNDSLSGGGGDDYLYGDAGNDVLHGNAGNDFLYGGDGTDSLFGDAGDDYLEGDAGPDLLNGGPGTDTWLDPWDTTDTRISLELP